MSKVFVRRKPSASRAATPHGFIRRSASGAAAVRQIVQAPAPRLSGGETLPATVRSHMEPRFGADFSNVTVHTDRAAAQSAAALGARAYTFGDNVVFGTGEYSPQSATGRRLIVHELAHVVQQRSGASQVPRVQRQVDPEYVVDEANPGGVPTGAPERIFFARNSATIAGARNAGQLDAFKSAAGKNTPLELLGLATEDELATKPTLPADRAKAVDDALKTPSATAPHGKHEAARKVTAGAATLTKDRPHLRFERAVELLRPGETSWNAAPTADPDQACSGPAEEGFQKAKQRAFDWIDATRRDVKKRPVAGAIAAHMDLFFGNHEASTARRLDHNFELIRKELERLAKAANHVCAAPSSRACAGAIAINVDGKYMIVCAGFDSFTPDEQASVVAHEAAHSTPGLRLTGKKNVAGKGTTDIAYRHERLLHVLGRISPDEALANSDSYAMFLVARQAAAALAGMSPPADPAPAGFTDADQASMPALALALAQRWIRNAERTIEVAHGVSGILGVGDPAPSFAAQIGAAFPPIL
jgi:hypothetical protein